MWNFTVESILQEKLQYSSYSAEESFTLSDILAERDEVDQALLKQEIIIEDDMFGDYFEGLDQDTGTDVFTIQTDKLQAQINKAQTQKLPNNNIPKGNDTSSSRQKSQINQSLAVSQQPKVVDRCKRIQSLAILPLAEIKNIAFIVLNNVTAAFDSTAKGVGIPTVITSNGVRFLAVGTSFGNVVLFQVGNKSKKVLGTAQNRKYGPITSISISKQGRYLVSGQENGLITVWDLYSFTQIKKELVTQAKIIKILFCSENQFILVDTQGNVLLFTIQNYFWVKIKRDRLFQKSESIFYDVKTHVLQSGIEVIVLCSLQQILVATYKPKIEPIDRIVRPEQLLLQKMPNVQIGKTAILSIQNPQNKKFQYNDVLCVSWSNHIFVYKFMEGVRLQKLILVYRFSQQAPIYNMQFISEGVLVTLDSKQTFRSFRIWLNDGGNHKLLNEKLIPQQVVYQRYFRDANNKYIKLFNNTIICCNFNPKQKQLYFICKNSIYRCRIYKWNEYVGDLITNENKYEQALKICMQIYYKRLDIFLQSVTINQKTLKVFCQVGKIYIEKRFELIQSLKLDRARNMHTKDEIKNVVKELEQTYDCIIQYMLEIRCGNQLFDLIYKDYIKKTYIQHSQYYHKFIECLEPFIMQGRVNQIPSKGVFDQIMQFYLSRGKKELVDHFIMFISIDSLSLFYEDAVEVCSQNKLYKSLAYVCSTHKDFISPLNLLLNEVKINQMHNLQNAQQTYYSILKDYIIKLLGSCFINGISFNDENATMKKSLSNWLMCKETFLFFSKNEVEAYHKDYFSFIQQLVYLLCGNPTLETYIHRQLKNITKEDIRGRQMAQLFIKISQIITLDEQQVKIVLAHSDSALIQKHLDKYLDFYKKNEILLANYPDVSSFYTKNKQLHYLNQLLKQTKYQGQKRSLLTKVDLISQPNQTLNANLTRYLLNKMNSQDIIWNIQDLLKIHSQNTMVFMLTRFPLQKINQRLMSIKDTTYRYSVVRKLLKMLRKDGTSARKKGKITKYHQKKESKIKQFLLHQQINYQKRYEDDTQSVSENVMEIGLSSSRQKPKVLRLSAQVMQFYLQRLCKYKNQKRVYYELICNPDDYFDNVDNLIKIAEKYALDSCLGLFQEVRKNYQKSYKHFQKVYRHFFFQQNYKKLMAKSQCHGRFMRRMFEKLLSLTELIGKDGSQWMQILKCVISPLQEKGKSKKYVCDDIQDIYGILGKSHPSLRQLGQIIEQCLTNVSNKIPIQTISKFIGQHQHVFSRMFVLDSLRKTLLSYSNNSKIFIIANQMFVNDQVSKFQEIYENLIKGFPPKIKCSVCKETFNQNSQMITHQCGHSFHKICPQDQNKVLQTRHYKAQYSQQQDQQNDQTKQNVEQQCPMCQFEKNKGTLTLKQQKIADFHRQQSDNLLVKGMVGIVSIIPNMISAIPMTMNVFSQKIGQEVLKQIQEEKFDKEELQDQIWNYLALQSDFQKRQAQNQLFIQQCSKYFSTEVS